MKKTGPSKNSLVLYLLAVVFVSAVCVSIIAVFFSYRALKHPIVTDVKMEGDWPYTLDGELGFVAVKNGASRREHLYSGLAYGIFSDARGARVNFRGEQKTPPVDIMTIGCSFSWGHGVDNEDTYTERLELKTGLKAVNFSMASYGTVQSLKMLRRNADFKPRIIIYGFIEDHLRRNLSPCAPNYSPYCVPVPYIAFDGSKAPYIHEPQDTGFSMDIERRFYGDNFMKTGFDLNSIVWQARKDFQTLKGRIRYRFSNDPESRAKAIDYLIGQMADDAKKMNARLVVVYIPYLRKSAVAPPPPELVGALRGKDLEFLDLTQPVNGHYEDGGKEPLHFEKDDHPSAAAHELIAAEIDRFLRAKRLVN